MVRHNRYGARTTSPSKLKDLDNPISLREAILSSNIASEDKKIIAIVDHSYIRAAHWYGTRQMLVKVFGHYNLNDEPPVRNFTYFYSLDLESNKWTLLERNHESELSTAGSTI